MRPCRGEAGLVTQRGKHQVIIADDSPILQDDSKNPKDRIWDGAENRARRPRSRNGKGPRLEAVGLSCQQTWHGYFLLTSFSISSSMAFMLAGLKPTLTWRTMPSWSIRTVQ